MIALIHQQGARVWSEARDCRGGWTGRTRWNPILLNERKVERFRAIRIQLTTSVDFQAVNVERSTPMRQITTSERRKSGRIELQFEERRSGKERSVLIAIRDAGTIGE